MKGGQIIDGILVANETIDDLKRRNRKGLISKIDLEKAYDKADCDFLRWVMKKKLWDA